MGGKLGHVQTHDDDGVDVRTVMIESPATGTDADADAAEVLAQQAAIAQIGQLALGERSLETLLVEACALVGDVLGAEFVSVSELAHDHSGARVVAGIGWP